MIKRELFKQELIKIDLNINELDGVVSDIYNAFVKSQGYTPIYYILSDFTRILSTENPFINFTSDYEINKIRLDNCKELLDFKGKFEQYHTMNNFIKEFPDGDLITIADGNALITDEFIIFKGDRFGLGIIAEPTFDLLKYRNLFVKKEEIKECILYAYIDNYGDISTRKLEPKVYDKIYYNSDFPMDRMKEIMSSDESELILFYGIPGGGIYKEIV